MVECRTCGESKPQKLFYPSQVRIGETVGECMECTKKRVRDNRIRRADYYRAYDANRFQNDPRVRARHRRYHATEAGKSSLQKSRGRWVAENPEKRKAHHAVNNAVRDGRLEKPEACERCGDRPGRIEGHHHDYSKPLEVEWLCRSCHAAEHYQVAAE